MPIKSYSETQKLLHDHLTGLKGKLSELDGNREVLLKEIEQAEKALASITTRSIKQTYNNETTFRQRILFCLNSRNKILSVNGMVSILTKLDDNLRKDKTNTAKSLRIQIRRMLQEEVLVPIKLDNMKNIHYALKEWLEENGEVKETYLL